MTIPLSLNVSKGVERLRRLTVAPALLILLAVGFLSSCASDVQNLYTKYNASFRFTPVTSIAPLLGALNNVNEFCLIWGDGNYYHFKTLTLEAQANKTSLSAYIKLVSVGQGFIVGKSSLTELGQDELPIVCYDRICPNCYENDGISRALTLQTGGYAICSRCTRRYDLNNFGQLASDTTGIKLFRYRIYYGNDVMAIQN